MNILFLGDIVGRLGRQTVAKFLPKLIKKHSIDFTFANAENLAGGRGATPETIDEMLSLGIDYFTSGNHIFHQKGFEKLLSDESFCLLRAANYPKDVAGQGIKVLKKDKKKIAVMGLVGQSLPGPINDPFRSAVQLLESLSLTEETLIPVIIDFHAEFTSEKRALGFYLDGKVAAVVGTHTHVPTADAQILPKGTAYVTDVGMCGSFNSVLGVEPKIIIKKQMYPYPARFEWVKKGPAVFNSVLIKINEKGQASQIQRLDLPV